MSRYVTVASVSHSPKPTYTENPKQFLDQAGKFIVRAKNMGADIVTFPEVYPQIGRNSEDYASGAESFDGPTVTFAREKAKENGLYVIWPTFLKEKGHVYNASILIDRQGEVTGAYHKMFPTMGEMENGITPGKEPLVFDTDFGRIGMAICFDLNFRPIIEGLAKNGAEIIFFSSMYRGGLQLRSWAHELRCYFVASIGAELGQIVDMSGTVLAESTYEALITQKINLDRKFLHMDLNWEKMDQMLEKYGQGLTFQYFTREGKYTIASEMPDKTAAEVIQEYGLLEQEDYFGRCTAMRAEKLQNI